MTAPKKTCEIIEIKLPEINQQRYESLIDFLAELLVAERLRELDQKDQYRRVDSTEHQRLTGGEKWN